MFLLLVKECLHVKTPLQQGAPEVFLLFVEGLLEPSA